MLHFATGVAFDWCVARVEIKASRRLGRSNGTHHERSNMLCGLSNWQGTGGVGMMLFLGRKNLLRL